METLHPSGAKIKDLKLKNFDDSYRFEDRETIY